MFESEWVEEERELVESRGWKQNANLVTALGIDDVISKIGALPSSIHCPRSWPADGVKPQELTERARRNDTIVQDAQQVTRRKGSQP